MSTSSQSTTTRDWSTLEHARGSAQDVPEILEGLRSADGERRATALRNGWSKLWSGKIWHSAQVPFVEALFELASDEGVEDRHRLLNLAANILTQGTGDKIPFGLDLNNANVAERYWDGVGADLHRLFVDQLPFLVKLMTQQNPALRAAAVECFSFVPEAPPLVVDPLLTAIDHEGDEAVLATMLHGLGLMIRYSKRNALSAVLDAHASSGPLVARACALTGKMSFDRSAYTADVRDLFVEAIALPDQPADRFPFKGGMLDQMISECVFAGGGLVPMWDFQTAAIQKGVASETTISRLANDLLASGLRRAGLTTRDELTPEQLAIVDELSQREIVARFNERGLPMKRSVRRRWLELDGPGPLNWPVELESDAGVQKCSIWKALMIADDEMNTRADLLRARFSPVARLEVFGDQALLESDPEFTDMLPQAFETNGYALLLESLEQAGGSALAWALRTTEHLLARPAAVDEMKNASLVPIVRSLGRDELLDERYDAAVLPIIPSWGQTAGLLSLLVEVLARIPLNRQEAIFLRAAARPRHGEQWLAETFALCPTYRVTNGILEAMDGRGENADAEWFNEKRARAMLEAMVNAARTHPEVAPALRSYVPVSDFLKAQLPGAVANLPA